MKRALLFVALVKTAITSAQETGATVFTDRARKTTKIYGTFEMGKKRKRDWRYEMF